jgi:hypothetical protein
MSLISKALATPLLGFACSYPNQALCDILTTHNGILRGLRSGSRTAIDLLMDYNKLMACPKQLDIMQGIS